MTTGSEPSGQQPLRIHGAVRERAQEFDIVDLLPRWHERIEVVRAELAALNHQRHIMRAFNSVINANERVLEHPGREFLNNMWRWYGESMAVAYRRQVDLDAREGRVASLRLILEEMYLRPDGYRLEGLRLLMPMATEQTIRESVMAPVVDANGLLRIDIVEHDLRELIDAGASVRDYVNSFVAHSNVEAITALQPGPTFGEIHAAQVACEQIAARWALALTGNYYRFPHDEFFAWLDIFDFPWRKDRPGDSPELRRYIVDVDPTLSEAEAALLRPSGDSVAPTDARDREILDVVARAGTIGTNQRLSSELAAGSLISVERLK